MNKKDLLTGDIVVSRDGSVGIVLSEKEVIIYPEEGYYFYYEITDDLLLDNEYRGGAIMTVYRGDKDDVISFIDYNDYDPIFERFDDVKWT